MPSETPNPGVCRSVSENGDGVSRGVIAATRAVGRCLADKHDSDTEICHREAQWERVRFHVVFVEVFLVRCENIWSPPSELTHTACHWSSD